MNSNIEIFVASPLYGGQCDSVYKNSMLALQVALNKEGIVVHFRDIVNQSLIPRARNKQVAQMKETSATHILFWDGDIAMAANHVLTMIAMSVHGYDVIAAPCPKKIIDWESVKEAILKNPNITVEQLKGCCGSMNFVRTQNEIDRKPLELDKVTEVEQIGTGVMLIKRRVFDLLESHFPDEWYYDHYAHLADRGAKIFDFFPVGINKKTRNYQPEDYGFCDRWTSIGGKIYMCPWMRTYHAGRELFSGNLKDIAECLMTETFQQVG